MTRAALLTLALTLPAFAAPVPRQPLTTASVCGRWDCAHWQTAAWVVWLHADGRYQCALADSPECVTWEGVWWLHDGGIEVREWPVGRGPEVATAHRIALSKLTNRRVLAEP